MSLALSPEGKYICSQRHPLSFHHRDALVYHILYLLNAWYLLNSNLIIEVTVLDEGKLPLDKEGLG
jgi:hypothetical protein